MPVFLLPPEKKEMAFVSPWELGGDLESESSLDLPRLGFEEPQVYAQGVSNDLGHVFVSDMLAEFSENLSVGFGQPDCGWLQLLLDGTGCISVSSPLQRFVSRLYTAAFDCPCVPKPRGAL